MESILNTNLLINFIEATCFTDEAVYPILSTLCSGTLAKIAETVLIVLKHAVLCRSVTSASATLRTVVSHAPLTAGFSQQEYWSGWPFPSPGDLPNPGIKPTSPASPALAGRLFTTEPPRKPSGSEEGSFRRIFQR